MSGTQGRNQNFAGLLVTYRLFSGPVAHVAVRGFGELLVTQDFWTLAFLDYLLHSDTTFLHHLGLQKSGRGPHSPGPNLRFDLSRLDLPYIVKLGD